MKHLAVAVLTSMMIQAPSARAQAPQPAAPTAAPPAPAALAIEPSKDFRTEPSTTSVAFEFQQPPTFL